MGEGIGAMAWPGLRRAAPWAAEGGPAEGLSMSGGSGQAWLQAMAMMSMM